MWWPVERVADSSLTTGVVLIMIGLLIGMPVGTMPSHADPPTSTDHGIPPDQFYTLWSKDQDAATKTAVIDGQLAIEELANGTDIPLDRPPAAVETWNRGDLEEFPTTTPANSIYPPDADLQRSDFIRDAYVEVFAVQPSTRARLSPSDQPLYVAPNGSVLGTVDYRVAMPADNTSGDHRVSWQLEDHAITEVRLIVDGTTVTTVNRTHTPSLDYSDLDAYQDGSHTLTLEATIDVTLEKHTRYQQRHCRPAGNETICWNEWHESYSHPTATVTVDDSIEVTEYDLTVAGSTARYPDGDLGLVIHKNQPWLGYSLPNGEIRGVWRFYSSRDTDWDTLIRSSESDTTTIDSPLHPLQTNAYPIEPGPTGKPGGTVQILDTYGVETTPPTLPRHIHLDILTQPYTASYGLATRSETTGEGVANVTAWGLVRGVTVDVQNDEVREIAINRSNLSLTILNRTKTMVTVQVKLTDAETNEPINTIARDGYIILAGHRVNTHTNGTIITRIQRPPTGLTARYEPGEWWWNTPGYTSDSETILIQRPGLQVISIIYQIGIPVSLFLIGVFIIDRITGWRVWPLWRGL